MQHLGSEFLVPEFIFQIPHNHCDIMAMDRPSHSGWRPHHAQFYKTMIFVYITTDLIDPENYGLS